MDGETLLLTNLSRYPLENVFNEEEFRLFYRCLPNKALHFKGDKCSGGKHSEVRLTRLAAGKCLRKITPHIWESSKTQMFLRR